MANIKTKIFILGISAAIMLCGCESSENGMHYFDTEKPSSANTVYASETTKIIKTEETEKTAEITEEQPYKPFDPFEVRKFPDDKVVPAEWIPVYSFAEAAKNFEEVVSSNISNMNTADAIVALANKNIIFVDSFTTYLFWKADPNQVYQPEGGENPLYPIISLNYYNNIQEIYDLGAETYTESALKKWYTPRNSYAAGNPFIEENGVFYVDETGLPKWNFAPFMDRSYIEILNETEDRCSFIWHTPDWEKLNEPEKGYEYFYYSCDCEAVYENGSWKLSKVYVEGYSLI